MQIGDTIQASFKISKKIVRRSIACLAECLTGGGAANKLEARFMKRRGKMALFRFRTRSPDRDLRTDVSRFAGIRQSLDEVRGALEQERDGLQRRYDEIAMNAAFSLENMENEGETEKISSKIDDYSQALERFTQRIAFLEEQLAFLRGIDETVADFAEKNGLVGADILSSASETVSS